MLGTLFRHAFGLPERHFQKIPIPREDAGKFQVGSVIRSLEGRTPAINLPMQLRNPLSILFAPYSNVDQYQVPRSYPEHCVYDLLSGINNAKSIAKQDKCVRILQIGIEGATSNVLSCLFLAMMFPHIRFTLYTTMPDGAFHSEEREIIQPILTRKASTLFVKSPWYRCDIRVLALAAHTDFSGGDGDVKTMFAEHRLFLAAQNGIHLWYNQSCSERVALTRNAWH